MNLVRSLRVLCLTAALLVSCGSTARPESAADASPSNASSSSATVAAVAASSVPPSSATVPSASVCPPVAAPVINPAPPTPIAAFAGTNGGSKVFAVIESVDLAGMRLTVTFSNSSTGGLPSGAPPTLRATLRVTTASRMQDVVPSRLPLAGAVAASATRLALGPGAPAMPAKGQVFVVSLDACQVAVVRQAATLAQAAPAGATEWVLTVPIGKEFPTGSYVVVSAFKPIQLADLRPGDLLVSGNPAVPFGLVFTGAGSDLVLTRLIRACYAVPCPFAPE